MPTFAVTDDTFEQEVLRSSLPVLVDFWAPWCGPCRTIAPALEELSDELQGVLRIGKLNTDESPGVAQAMRIQSIPTMYLFEGGQPTQVVQGALPKEELSARIRSWLPAAAGPNINVETLGKLIDDGQPVTVFDVRREQDYVRSHLRHAKCVAEADLVDAVAEVTPGVPVVLICRTGEVSLELAKKLNADGVAVQALEKGLLEWEGSGRPTWSTREEEKLDRDGAG